MARNDSRTTGDRRRGAEAASADRKANRYGISITLLGGVLCALSYYAVIAFRSGQLSALSLPEPLYLLAVVFLFVIELLKSRHKGYVALLRGALFALLFGALVVLGVEGVISLVGNPTPAVQNYAGITVLSVALVVSALAYFVYLSIIQFDRKNRIGG